MTTWNPADKAAGITLTNSNLTATSNGTNSLVRSTTSNSSGKLYGEFTATTVNGTAFRVGFANSTHGLTSALGGNTNGVGYASNNGAVTINGVTIGTAATYTTGNLIGVAVDFTNKLVWFAVNGGNWNNSGTANPATGAGGFSLSTLAAGPYFIAFYGNFGGNACTMAPAGGSFTPPSGFSPWDSSSISVSATGLVTTSGAGASSYAVAVAARGASMARGNVGAGFSAPLAARGAGMARGRCTGSYSASVSGRAAIQTKGAPAASFSATIAACMGAMTRGAAAGAYGLALAARGAMQGKGRAGGSYGAALIARGSVVMRGAAGASYVARLAARLTAALKGLAGLARPIAPFDPDYALLAPSRTESFLAPSRTESMLAPFLTEAFLAE